MNLTLHPGAERDLAEAAAFYEREGSPALAARFVADFKRASQRIAPPKIRACRSKGRCRLNLDVSPFTVMAWIPTLTTRILVLKDRALHADCGKNRT